MSEKNCYARKGKGTIVPIPPVNIVKLCPSTKVNQQLIRGKEPSREEREKEKVYQVTR